MDSTDGYITATQAASLISERVSELEGTAGSERSKGATDTTDRATAGSSEASEVTEKRYRLDDVMELMSPGYKKRCEIDQELVISSRTFTTGRELKLVDIGDCDEYPCKPHLSRYGGNHTKAIERMIELSNAKRQFDGVAYSLSVRISRPISQRARTSASFANIRDLWFKKDVCTILLAYYADLILSVKIVDVATKEEIPYSVKNAFGRGKMQEIAPGSTWVTPYSCKAFCHTRTKLKFKSTGDPVIVTFRCAYLKSPLMCKLFIDDVGDYRFIVQENQSRERIFTCSGGGKMVEDLAH